jgi:hypothetical protein
LPVLMLSRLWFLIYQQLVQMLEMVLVPAPGQVPVLMLLPTTATSG